MAESILVMFIGGIILFVMGFKWLKKLRTIQNIPTSNIRSLAMGLVEINGTVQEVKEYLTSPVTQKDCVYYEYEVKEKRGSGKHSRWVTIRSKKDYQYFYLQDTTGSVLIDPSKARVSVEKSYSDSTFGFNGFSKESQEFFRREHIDYEGIFGVDKTMRITEYIVRPAQQLYIMGTAGDNPFVDEATAKDNIDDIIITKGKQQPYFFISDKPENSIVTQLKWKTISGLFGGPALIVLSIALMFS